MTHRARLDIEPLVVVGDNQHEALLNFSSRAAVVMLGFDPPAPGHHVQFFQEYEVLAEGMPDTILVSSAGKLDLEA